MSSVSRLVSMCENFHVITQPSLEAYRNGTKIAMIIHDVYHYIPVGVHAGSSGW
jgi:hypothetical protein